MTHITQDHVAKIAQGQRAFITPNVFLTMSHRFSEGCRVWWLEFNSKDTITGKCSLEKVLETYAEKPSESRLMMDLDNVSR